MVDIVIFKRLKGDLTSMSVAVSPGPSRITCPQYFTSTYSVTDLAGFPVQGTFLPYTSNNGLPLLGSVFPVSKYLHIP